MPSRGQHWKRGGLVDGTVVADDIDMFVSAVLTGTGSAQTFNHGLSGVPSITFLSVINFGANVAVDVVEGTHTATDCVVTATSGVKYQILAIA